MGQQQLLLIVLGVIIVGIAVVVGINLFNANAETATQDSIISQGTALGAMVQQYYKKPDAMGGGGNTFSGTHVTFDEFWANLPAELVSSHDADWAYAGAANQGPVTLTATPKDSEYATKWTVTTEITPTSITSNVATL